MGSKAKNSNLRIIPSPVRGYMSRDARRVTLPPGAHDYYQRIEAYAQRIRNTHDIPEIIGILDEALRETQGLAGHHDLKLAVNRVAQAEREIANLKAELQEAVTQVQIDQLTQVLNRRGLEESFARESARSDRHGAPLCVALIDVDNFKSVNDTFGHPTGDAALVHLAKTLRRTLRPVDVVARYGGEEFVVLLPESDEEAARAAMSRVQRRAKVRSGWAIGRMVPRSGQVPTTTSAPSSRSRRVAASRNRTEVAGVMRWVTSLAPTMITATSGGTPSSSNVSIWPSR